MSTSTTCSSSSSSEQPEPESEHTPSTITTCTIVSNIDPEPPVYDDPCHPWSSSHIQSGIQSDEDEDEEHLPPYECTVSRAGQVHVKREREDENTLSKKRSWRNLYVVVWGTSIRAYKKQPTNPETERPVWSFSMQHAEAGMATDYRKYPDVVRVRIRHGPQFLIRCSTYMSAVLWIDAIQASANVCEDLDTRCMPEFSFGRRLRRSRPHRRSPTNTPTSR
ncbi:hypothetical protein O0I10_010220 [Lichtheimia ornata]|uniref:PH domain-containing protein n=1 Tax=Lichtheimia ornata TaxID=688661 RepID=A0AAD7UV50_9FUNG|nr:uncharacterized protein O0I10_010220 [Lichtheimia ornata]KAJ8654144.1 hypothetical protein O0I10_010220 [Lichtheimia ornata]